MGKNSYCYFLTSATLYLSRPGSADFLIGKNKNLSEDESSHLIFQKKYVIIYM